MTSLFEGKCGPSVDELPKGPNIALWAETGYQNNLSGLQIDYDFGNFGNVRGICTYIEESDEFQIEWRHGPDFHKKTSFISKHNGDNAHDIIGMYVQEKSNKEHCDWIQYIEEGLMKESLLDFLKIVQSAPGGTKFVNWKQPFHLDDDPDFINIVDEDKWYFTMAKLNDPRMAHVYGGDGYSTLSVLTLYLICVHFHGFYEPLPIMVTKDNEQIFKLSDMMCPQLSGSSSSHGGVPLGYGQLMTFERIITRITTEYPPNEAKTNYNVWKGGYHNAQALMLVLSSKFEEAMWDYDMVDDPIRVEKLIGNFCRVFGSYMSPVNAPSDEAREQLQRDLNLNDEHLRAGVFFFDAESEQKDLFSETVARCLKEE